MHSLLWLVSIFTRLSPCSQPFAVAFVWRRRARDMWTPAPRCHHLQRRRLFPSAVRAACPTRTPVLGSIVCMATYPACDATHECTRARADPKHPVTNQDAGGAPVAAISRHRSYGTGLSNKTRSTRGRTTPQLHILVAVTPCPMHPRYTKVPCTSFGNVLRSSYKALVSSLGQLCKMLASHLGITFPRCWVQGGWLGV